jgi:hypothetical protein
MINANKDDVPELSRDTVENFAQMLLHASGREIRTVADLPVPIDYITEIHLKLKFSILNLRRKFKFDVAGALWVMSDTKGRVVIDRKPRRLQRARNRTPPEL